ncbi:MAG: glutaredoxin family protein [Proteobacteria bacterium]|nr:glutaredoxin family protein [Pseudomonadota bacterium]
MSRLRLYSREGCGLCEELLQELAPWAAAHGTAIEQVDVDADTDSRRRYGHRVPVLTLDGETVCSGRLDWHALERLWAATG